MALWWAAAYFLVGMTFGKLSDWAGAGAGQLVWRRLAWVVSGIGFAAHIASGYFRLGNAPLTTALYAGLAAALGAGGLAAAANVHAWASGAPYRPLLAVALVAWPLLTFIPAFAVALLAASLLQRWRPRVR